MYCIRPVFTMDDDAPEKTYSSLKAAKEDILNVYDKNLYAFQRQRNLSIYKCKNKMSLQYKNKKIGIELIDKVKEYTVDELAAMKTKYDKDIYDTYKIDKMVKRTRNSVAIFKDLDKIV